MKSAVTADWNEMIAHAIQDERPRLVFRLGPIPEIIATHASLGGRSLNKHTYEVHAHAIRHAINGHSDAVVEEALGNIALDGKHLDDLLCLLRDPHRVEAAPCDLGKVAFYLERDFGARGTARCVVEESSYSVETHGRFKQKFNLQMKTFYWLKAKKQGLPPV